MDFGAHLDLIRLVLLALVCAGVGFLIWRLTRKDGLGSRSPEAAVAGPLLPGEARWTINNEGTVTHSLVHPVETGFQVGEAVGKKIWEWAPVGSHERAEYEAALANRTPRRFTSRYDDPEGLPRYAVVQIVALDDGGLYCESWDITSEVLPREAECERMTEERDRLAERAEELQGQYDALAHTVENSFRLVSPARDRA